MADDLRAAAERVVATCREVTATYFLDALAASPEFLAWAVREAMIPPGQPVPLRVGNNVIAPWFPKPHVAALLGGD